MQAVAELQKLGGRVTTDDQGVVTAVDLAQTAITDTDLKLLADCPELAELNLRGTLVGDSGLEAIAAATQLEFLGLTGTMVTDEGLHHLRQLTRLRFLTLGHTAVTDGGIESLADCRQLEGLNLKATPITAAGLVELQARLPNCRIVSDITATSTIDSSDLPLPMPSDGSISPEAPEEPLPRATDPVAPTERPLDPFERIQPLELPESGLPSAEPDQLPGPPSAGRAIQGLRRRSVSGGPARRLEDMLTNSLGDPVVLRAIARSYAAQGEWEAASTVLRAALQQTPDDPELQFELGVAEARSGDYVSALMHLQQCGSLAVAHYNLGILMHEAGFDDASILAFRSALKYDPQLYQARAWLSDFAPKQARSAAAANGRRPSMIGGPVIAPVEGQRPESLKQTAANTDGRIKARRSSLQSVIRLLKSGDH